jgi:hypothetical protein
VRSRSVARAAHWCFQDFWAKAKAALDKTVVNAVPRLPPPPVPAPRLLYLGAFTIYGAQSRPACSAWASGLRLPNRC